MLFLQTQCAGASVYKHQDTVSLQAALNVDTSVSRIGLYGDQSEKLWCLSHTETLHLWEWLAACDEESTGGHEHHTLGLQYCP